MDELFDPSILPSSSNLFSQPASRHWLPPLPSSVSRVSLAGPQRRHRVRVNPIYTMANVAIAVTEGIGKQLDPSLDLVQQALPFFMTLHQQGKL
jgi:hypothetical protein